ncbi:MAG: hypothetical protein IIX35_05245, partial [Paraprevotella sp.]|nr:hypothetical protein [Paraprevotella sp.]
MKPLQQLVRANIWKLKPYSSARDEYKGVPESDGDFQCLQSLIRCGGKEFTECCIFFAVFMENVQ